MNRSSRPEVFCKKGVLTNFTKLTGKHRCQSFFFCKSHLFLRPATLLKQRLWHRCFPVNFAKFLRTPFLTEHLRWLLLNEEILNKDTKYDVENICHEFPDLRMSSSSQLICHQVSNQLMYRSSHRWCSLDLQYYQKRPQHRHFPVNIAKFLRTPISKNICKRLLLIVVIYCTKN